MHHGTHFWWQGSCWAMAVLLALQGVVSGQFSEPAETAQQKAEIPDIKLTALLFYATDEPEIGADKAPLKRIADPEKDTERYLPALKKAAEAPHYHLIGRDSAELRATYSIWLRPSPQFPLQIEHTGISEDGGLFLYWILWQKEPVEVRKDRELVKSNTILTQQTPLVIAGPKWRGGRLLFVVRRN